MNKKSSKTWPLILFSIPFAAVIVGIVMIVIVIKFPDDVVVDDYYKDGMAINQQLAQDEKARELGVSANLVSINENVVVFDIPGIEETAISLQLFHVTSKKQDRRFVLLNQGNGQYKATDPDMALLQQKGVWYLELTAPDGGWRLRSRIETPLSNLELGYE